MATRETRAPASIILWRRYAGALLLSVLFLLTCGGTPVAGSVCFQWGTASQPWRWTVRKGKVGRWQRGQGLAGFTRPYLHIKAVSCREQPPVSDEDSPALVLLPPKPEADLPGPFSSSCSAPTHDLAEGQGSS